MLIDEKEIEHVCVCVCVREREREGERESVWNVIAVLDECHPVFFPSKSFTSSSSKLRSNEKKK